MAIFYSILCKHNEFVKYGADNKNHYKYIKVQFRLRVQLTMHIRLHSKYAPTQHFCIDC